LFFEYEGTGLRAEKNIYGVDLFGNDFSQGIVAHRERVGKGVYRFLEYKDLVAF